MQDTTTGKLDMSIHCWTSTVQRYDSNCLPDGAVTRLMVRCNESDTLTEDLDLKTGVCPLL